MIQTSCRGFLTGLGAIITAPAIVRVSSIMPVKVVEASGWQLYPALREVFGSKIMLPGFTVIDLKEIMDVMKEQNIPMGSRIDWPVTLQIIPMRELLR